MRAHSDQAESPGQIINALPAGKFAKLGRVDGGGSLEARRLTAGVQFYWRYTTDGKTDRLPIGTYDSGAPPKSLEPTPRGFSVRAAMRKAQELAQQHRNAVESGGLRAKLAAQKEARVKAEQQTLDKLLDAYCDYLEQQGRTSHRAARSIFKLHVREAWPKVAAKPAAEVTAEDVADMMRRVVERGNGRTANKLRSYLRAAFQTAKAARTKPSIPVAFKDFGVTANPAADTEPDETANKPDKRPLTRDEMRAYWRAIRNLDGHRGALLRLHLLTGGQRIEQLVKLSAKDIEPGAITLYDGKGRPGRPARPHAVPLTKAAAAALTECRSKGAFALSTDGGETHIAATTLSAWAKAAAGNSIADFQAKRIRSGVETLLASLGVSKDIRGRLQSHGVSGVQARHYDGHDYMAEKLDALTRLEKALQIR